MNADPSRVHFNLLPREEQIAAVRRLANSGMSDHGISHATGWAVEMVRRAIAESVQRQAVMRNA